MKKILFVDIDGVFNSRQTLIKNNADRLFYGRLSKLSTELLVKWHLSYMDFEKIALMKRICELTGAELVIISAWKDLDEWSLIEGELIRIGLPIVGVTSSEHSRGVGILDYVVKNDVENYFVLDDDYFPDYDSTIGDHLIKCDYYNDGLSEELAEEVIKMFLNLDEKRKILEHKV